MKLTKNVITREQALALCPDYVAYVEGDHDKFEKIWANFETVRRGCDAVTGYKRNGKITFLRVKISSVNHNDPRAMDGPLVRVSNGEFSWRVDGCDYAYVLHKHSIKNLRAAFKPLTKTNPDLAI